MGRRDGGPDAADPRAGGGVLEVALSPDGGGDALALRRYVVGAGWQALYQGPVGPLQPEPRRVECPKCRHRWAPQTKTGQPPQKCPKCSYRVGAYWRRQAAEAKGNADDR